MKSFKIEIDGREIEITVKKPLAADVSEADKVYAQAVAKLIDSNEKYLFKSQLDRYLAENKIWTEKDEKEAQEIEAGIQKNLEMLKKGGIKLSVGREIALNTTILRIKLMDHMSKRQGIEDVTIESLATDDRFDYLVYACTINTTDNKQFWETLEDLKADKLTDVYRMAKSSLISLIFGVSEQIEKSLPENKWLLKHGMVDENLTLIHPKTKTPVDRQGRDIKVLAEESEKQMKEALGEITEEEPYIDDYESPVQTV